MKFLDPLFYLQGHIRYMLYYRCPFLMRRHIKEQIDMRIEMMNKECLQRGSCVICGCKTTHLQMANKICDGNCYPRLFSKEEWKNLKYKGDVILNSHVNNTYLLYKNVGTSVKPVIIIEKM